MKKLLFAIALGLIAPNTSAQEKYPGTVLKVSPLLEGTLLLPPAVEDPPLAIIIAGSGPTDRDGNQMMMRTNAYKQLAQQLYDKGIASFRYDKRSVKYIKERNVSSANILFDDFIDDARAVLKFFEGHYKKIYVIGHSQGSLIGMVAARGAAAGFISVAGPGQAIDDVIVAQLQQQVPALKDSGRKAFDELRAKGTVLDFDPGLTSIFRQDIQPFMHSWMQYGPKTEIQKLNMPVLIINGDKDIQVAVSEAELLKEARPGAQLAIIAGMNHIFKEIKGGDIENRKSYNQPERPIMPLLVEKIATFIKQ
ncbi:MAG: alpha/beta hydrolase family protein [Marinirhabdus sp.]